MKKTFFFLTALLTVAPFSAYADDALIIKRLQSLGAQNIEIKPSPLKGIKTVITSQGILYTSEDGKYVLQGKLYEVTDQGFTDVANKMLLDKLNALQSEMIVYPAKNEKFVVTVFMDITCQYCHLLHQQVKEYNELGITLRYLAFPRTGLNSQTAKQMESIWADKNPQFAFSEAENGTLPKTLKTPKIVKTHYDLGVQFGVRGTPSIITASGEMLGGYLEPQQLLEALEQEKN